jgi:hypothetical protein
MAMTAGIVGIQIVAGAALWIGRVVLMKFATVAAGRHSMNSTLDTF